MTALRRRMIEDMRVRNLAANTQRVYVASDHDSVDLLS